MKFETGKTYTTRSACDHECIFSYTIVRRTEKSVWITGVIGCKGKPVRRSIKISDIDGSEFIFPEGQYSMCPVLRAE